MSSGVLQRALPIAGAVGGFMLGGPAGAVAGMQLGSGAGSLFGGGQQPMAPGVTPEQGPMMPGQMRNPQTGAIEQGQPQMALLQGAPGNGAKAAMLKTAMMLGEMGKSQEARGLLERELAAQESDARARWMVNPQAAPSNMGSYGPNAGMAYLGR
jgi:hypothetical protein